MKKFKKIAYVILLVAIIVLSLTLYTSATKQEGNSEKEKVFTEVRYLESKLINLFNSMNNIQYQNYSISVSEITKEGNNQSGGSPQGGGGEGGSSRRRTRKPARRI